jgi:hypothetical protein
MKYRRVKRPKDNGRTTADTLADIANALNKSHTAMSLFYKAGILCFDPINNTSYSDEFDELVRMGNMRANARREEYAVRFASESSAFNAYMDALTSLLQEMTGHNESTVRNAVEGELLHFVQIPHAGHPSYMVQDITDTLDGERAAWVERAFYACTH